MWDFTHEHKASGPDRISPYILKHCADEIMPIVYVSFNYSLSTSLLSNDWLKANIYVLCIKRVIAVMLITIDPYLELSSVPKL